MRLLCTDTGNGLKLEVFTDPATTPPYAILSHRWGSDEVLYGDLMSEALKEGPRFNKILRCCERARKDGYAYVWIDTCCIDQKSSAELSESINSMFMWYANAAVCYAYLQDVSSFTDNEDDTSAFRDSIWFTRGWTLQELIAPFDVIFLTETWDLIGDKRALAERIESITNINCGVLRGGIDLHDVSIAEKMSWAANRRTTKVEDRAYSLLGLFGVNMPTIYGEGQRAFQRLQQEIINQSNDHSIFAWEAEPTMFNTTAKACGLLAPSPDAFAKSGGTVTIPFVQFASSWGYKQTLTDIQKTNAGFRLEVPIIEGTQHIPRSDGCVMVIACKKPLDTKIEPPSYHTLGIVLQLDSEGYYNRMANTRLLDADQLTTFKVRYRVEQIDIRGQDTRVRADVK